MFESKNGKAQWETVVEILTTKNIGDIVTYDEVLEALGPDFPKAAMSGVVWKAIRKFRDHKRTFENVRKVGWMMVEATEHSRLARKQQVRSQRRLKDAMSISASADLSRLDPASRREIQAQFLHLSKLHDQVSRRVDKVEQRMDVAEKAQLTADDKLDQLKDLLRRHGISDDE